MIFLFSLLLAAQAEECNGENTLVSDLSRLMALQRTSVDGVYSTLAKGDYATAKGEAHGLAQQGRLNDQPKLVEKSGVAWQVADKLEQAMEAIGNRDYQAAKRLASEAADLTRTLVREGVLDSSLGGKVLEEAGLIWNKANDLGGKAASDLVASTPMLDQHNRNSFDHPQRSVFCGVATTVMMAQANGIDIGTGYQDLDRVGRQIYIPGNGSSGSAMAGFLRDQGLENSNFTTTGTLDDINRSLKAGQPVPLGVVSSQGTIHAMGNGGYSARYGQRTVNQTHSKSFGPDGHWVLVTGAEGNPDNPSAYIVNDPDLGGQLRVTPSQLAKMGVRNGSLWVVRQ